MTEQELLAQLDEQQKIIDQQKKTIEFLQKENQDLDDLYVWKICKSERLSEKIHSLEIDIERLRKINRESALIKELREKYKPVTK